MPNQNNSPKKPVVGELKEPHLLDPANLQEIAQWLYLWLISTGVGGVIGGFTYDAVKRFIGSLRENQGPSRIMELEQKIVELHEQKDKNGEMSPQEFKSKLREFLKDFK